MSETRYDIKGPGLIRAVQEAVSANKDIAVVHDYDNFGRILRVGYFLKDKGIKDVSQPIITWFDSNEIQITCVNTPVRDFKRACLDVEFSHPRDNERHFLLFLTLDKETRVILRNLFRVYKNLVTGFVIQVEIRSILGGKEQWRPLVRYDQTKQELETQETKDAIVLAIDEIRENLNLWLHQLGYKTIDEDSLSQPRIIQEMDRAKSKLLELYENPEKLDSMQSTFTQLKEEFDYNCASLIFPPAIDKALAIFRKHGLEVAPGVMSSVVSGDDEALFTAIKDVFHQTSEQGGMVMVVTLSNACPIASCL